MLGDLELAVLSQTLGLKLGAMGERVWIFCPGRNLLTIVFSLASKTLRGIRVV